MTGQLNVTPIAERSQPVPPCHFTITCMIGGFPVQLEGDGRAADLKLIIERLQLIGAEPPVAKAEPTKGEKSTPLCPVHGSKMKEGRRGFFCPKKVGDDYCKEVA
jgi:hypothetical protein